MNVLERSRLSFDRTDRRRRSGPGQLIAWDIRLVCYQRERLWVAKVVLPWMAEAFATSIFMSGGNVTPDSEDAAKPDEQGREDEVKEEAPADRQDKDPS